MKILKNLISRPPSAGSLTAPVANASLATMAADRIKGRAHGAGTGVPQDLTAAQVRTIIGASSYTPNGVIADSTTVTATDTETIFSNGTRNISANTLVAGCMMQIRAVMRADGVVAAGDANFKLYLNGLAGSQLSATTVSAAGDYVILDFQFKVRVIGASGKMTGVGYTDYLLASVPTRTFIKTPSALDIDTTAPITFDCAVVHSSNSADTQTVLEAMDLLPFGFSL